MHANALGKDEENKILKGELVTWVNRWQELKLNKDKSKAVNISLTITHERLLKQLEQQKFKIVKLQARLSEARRGAKLQIST